MCYKRISKIDYGQYSKIYLVENEEGEKQVLKVCLKESGYSFCVSYREADIAYRFCSPHVISLLATYQGEPFAGTDAKVSPLGVDHVSMTQDVNHLVYELASCNFVDFVTSDPPPSEILSCICDILLGVEHMHLSGYCHRDLRCDNILVFKDGEGSRKTYAKVADFGFTKYLIRNGSNTPTINNSVHRAPECLAFCRNYGFGVDMWSLGCMVYITFCYQEPFQCNGRTYEAAVKNILNNLPVECGGDNNRQFDDFFPDKEYIPEYEKVKQLLIGLLQFNDKNRITSTDALNLPLFDRYRKRIEMTREQYPAITLPDPPLEIHSCIERTWGMSFFRELFNNKQEKTNQKWYSDSKLFFAMSIFEQILVYYQENEKPIRSMESLTSGRFFTKKELNIIYITCLYFAFKYKSGTSSTVISYDMIYPNFNVSPSEKKFAANFEIKLFTEILNHEIFRKTLYDCLIEEYGDPSRDDLNSLVWFAIYGHHKDRKLKDAYEFWKRNADYYLS